MKKCYALLLVCVVAVSGGCRKKKNSEQPTTKKDVRKEIDIPVANEGINSLFDADLNEFALSDDTRNSAGDSVNNQVDVVGNEYAWMNEEGSEFKKVYFDFDQYAIRDDQEKNLVFDVAAIKAKIEQAKAEGKELPLLVVDGHACHSAGSRAYNLALSEKRAKVVADHLIAQGIPQECIKIVGRGDEVPAVVNGQAVAGNREQQAPNRRDELHIVHA